MSWSCPLLTAAALLVPRIPVAARPVTGAEEPSGQAWPELQPAIHATEHHHGLIKLTGPSGVHPSEMVGSPNWSIFCLLGLQSMQM